VTRPALSFADVSLVFPDGTAALDRITFQVEPAEVVSLVGPSGCGKSTLLRVAAGLTRPTGGAVLQGSSNGLAMVPQDPTLLPWRSVRRNIELLLELRGENRTQRAARVEEVLELVGLRSFAGHRPRELSGGMRMRVSVARALALQPDVVLLDEPFAAVDEMTRERLCEELLRLFAHRHTAGVFVTHSIAEAVFVSDRVLVLSARPGRIVQDIPVPLAHPRADDVRSSARFAEIAAQVRDALRQAVP